MNEVFLGNFELAEAKLIQLRLKDSEIFSDIRANEHTCNTKNCKVTVELWGLEKDLEQLQSFFKNDFLKNLGNTELNYEALNSVFDPSQESVTCQACGFQFSSKLTECPDCGLCY
jgi:hypothetical protein